MQYNEISKLLHHGEEESKKASATIKSCAGAYFSKVDVTTPCLAYPAPSAEAIDALFSF